MRKKLFTVRFEEPPIGRRIAVGLHGSITLSEGKRIGIAFKEAVRSAHYETRIPLKLKGGARYYKEAFDELFYDYASPGGKEAVTLYYSWQHPSKPPKKFISIIQERLNKVLTEIFSQE